MTTAQASIKTGAEATSVAPSGLVVYDEDGDLTVRVGPELKPYQVDSRTLSRSSPVLKKMLYGGFAESRPTDGSDWTVDLPDDASDAMEIVLRIVHGAFDMVPKHLALWQLYSLLALTEKYDATRLLRPWAKTWVQHEIVKHGAAEPELLCVAWELGDIDLFKQMVDKITKKCHMSHDGEVLYGRRWRTWTSNNSLGPPEFAISSLKYLMPPDIQEIVARAREKIVVAELKPYIDLYVELRSGRCKRGYREIERWRCDSLALGSLVKSLSNANIDINKPDVAGTYLGSLENLSQALSEVKIEAICTECEKAIKTAVAMSSAAAAELMKGITVVRDSHWSYLESQAKKTGFPLVAD